MRSSNIPSVRNPPELICNALLLIQARDIYFIFQATFEKMRCIFQFMLLINFYGKKIFKLTMCARRYYFFKGKKQTFRNNENMDDERNIQQ